MVSGLTRRLFLSSSQNKGQTATGTKRAIERSLLEQSVALQLTSLIIAQKISNSLKRFEIQKPDSSEVT